MMTHPIRILASIVSLLLFVAPIHAQTIPASPYDTATPAFFPPTDYSGDLLHRTTLTGTWGGWRDTLAQHGITFDAYLTQVGQGVVSGGRDTGWKYMGRGDFTINFDIHKMGGWRGGYLIVEGEGQYGENVNRATGSLIPVNMNALLPQPNETQFNIPAVSYIQFFTPQIGLIVGKVDTIFWGDRNHFAHGKGDRQFLNSAFNFNPTLGTTVPASALAAGLLVKPTSDITLICGALDSEGRSDSSGCATAFNRGTTYVIESRFTTHFFNLTGHQLFGGTYSDRSFVDLTQPRSNFTTPGTPIQRVSNSWCANYNFDQYLYQPDEKVDRGWGVFGRFAASDGIANPIHFFASIGLGAKGIIPGRKNDQCGIGYYYMVASNVNTPQQATLHDSQGFEAYYEFALTPSILLTPDIQVMQPSLNGPDVATVLGIRLTMKF